MFRTKKVNVSPLWTTKKQKKQETQEHGGQEEKAKLYVPENWVQVAPQIVDLNVIVESQQNSVKMYWTNFWLWVIMFFNGGLFHNIQQTKFLHKEKKMF